jgi:serine/threonine protein kinase
MFIQIASAMYYLAHRGIAHGDLACRNVLVYNYHETDLKQNVVKLTDFGLSRFSSLYSTVNSTATIDIIPIRYAAPEVLDNNRPDEKSDIFSMGVLMWEAYEKGRIPWSQIHDDNEVRRLVIGGARLMQPSTCASDMWCLIEECWMIEKQNRPTFKDLQEKLQSIYYSTRPPGCMYIVINLKSLR